MVEIKRKIVLDSAELCLFSVGLPSNLPTSPKDGRLLLAGLLAAGLAVLLGVFLLVTMGRFLSG